MVERIIEYREKFHDSTAMNPEATSTETYATFVPDSLGATGGARQGLEVEDQKH